MKDEGGVSEPGDTADTLRRAMAEVGEGNMCRGGVVSRNLQEARGFVAGLRTGKEVGRLTPDCSGVAGSELLASESFSASDTGLRSSVKGRSRCLNPAKDVGRSGDERDEKCREADLALLSSLSGKKLGTEDEFTCMGCGCMMSVALTLVVERQVSCTTPLETVSMAAMALPRDRGLFILFAPLTTGPAAATLSLFINMNPDELLAVVLLG